MEISVRFLKNHKQNCHMMKLSSAQACMHTHDSLAYEKDTIIPMVSATLVTVTNGVRLAVLHWMNR